MPEHMRKGVGSRLIETVCRWARDAGHAKITLSTFRDVPWNRPFYESRGFQVVDAQHPDAAAPRDGGHRALARTSEPFAGRHGAAAAFARGVAPRAPGRVRAGPHAGGARAGAGARRHTGSLRGHGRRIVAAARRRGVGRLPPSTPRRKPGYCLLTYARGEALNKPQRAALAREGTQGAHAPALVSEVSRAIDRPPDQLRQTPPETLLRTVQWDGHGCRPRCSA